MRILNRLILLVSFPGWASGLHAQDVQFEHLAMAEGLANDVYIRAIVQDRQGFLWVGASGGSLNMTGMALPLTCIIPSQIVSYHFDVITVIVSCY